MSERYRQLSNAVRKQFCQHGSGVKAFADGIEAFSGLPTIYGDLYDTMCSLPGDAPPPRSVPPNINIKPNCVGQRYNLKFRYQVSFNAPNEDTRNGYWGPISTAIEGDFLVFYSYGDGGSPSSEPVRTVLAGPASPVGEFSLIQQVPANPDTFVPCERPTLPVVPPDIAPLPPIPPVELPPVFNAPGVQIPIYLRPIVIRPNIEFKPKFSFDVGGVNINFGHDGWDFTFSPNVDVDVVINPSVKGPGPVLPPAIQPHDFKEPNNCPCDDSSSGSNVDLTPVLNAIASTDSKVVDTRVRVNGVRSVVDSVALTQVTHTELLEDIQECVCVGEEELFTTVGPVGSFDLDFGFKVTRVEIAFSNPPAPNKRQNGGDAPDVWYAGWYAFGSQFGLMPRQSLHYKQMCLVPEDGRCTRFSFTAYEGLVATIKVFRRKENG